MVNTEEIFVIEEEIVIASGDHRARVGDGRGAVLE
jgi:hypothetical protein